MGAAPSTASTVEQVNIEIGSSAAQGFAVGGPIGAGVGAIKGAIQAGIQQFAQHTARLKDAANENAALDQVIPAFDADLAAITSAFNSGTDPNDCISALLTVDSNIYTYLRTLVGKPGTSWGGPTASQIGSGINPTYSAACDKTCTASCCVYLNDLRPAIFGRSNNGHILNSGMIPAILDGGGTVAVSAVAPPPNKAYGNYGRAAYSLKMALPPISFAAQALSVSGVNVSASPSSAVAAPGIVGTLTGTTVIAILGLVGGLILIITALFGQNALRVNR